MISFVLYKACHMYARYLKRWIDFIIAIILIILTSPLIVSTILVLLLANKGKIFFTQQRPGLFRKPFKIIKFKTMNDKKDNDGNLLPDNKQISPIGKLIRKTSIDELPQLFNVLKGDLSLIGPRPLLMEYLPLYSKEQAKRHNVKPGISGWAQVNGRNAITWEQKFQYDLYYIKNISFLLDLKIIILTIREIIMLKGINSPEKTIMEPFRGKNN